MTASVRRLLLLSIGFTLVSAAVAAVPYVVDGDADAVSDEIDECPYTQPGVQVDKKGCALRRDDVDVDGVPDVDDDCPYSSAGATVDFKGCALDGDFDGVANGLDRCPSTALALLVDQRGCAKGEQQVAFAAAKPAPRRVAAVTPEQPALSPVLPARAAETAVVAGSAAPIIASQSATAEAPELKLMFLADSARLGTGDLAAIEGYARIFQRQLLANPAARLQLRAYADAREAKAADLAETRLQVVRAALLAHGIAPGRIDASSGIIQDGEAGANRRVEAALSN